MNAQLINPLLNREWDRMILQHPDSSIFHSAAWARVLSKTYRHEPLYLCCLKNKEFQALVPMMEIRSRLTGCRGVGLPFTDRCPPLVFNEEVREFLLKSLSAIAKKRGWRHFELRGGTEWPGETAPSTRFYEHTLDLRKNPAMIFASFSSANRRAIRKAEKNAVWIEVTQSQEAVRKYYLLHVKTRKRHGLPPQPFSFFQNIQEAVIEQDLGFVVLAHTDSIPIAGAIFFHFGKSAIYKFGASDERFQEFRGNNLVMWKAIQVLSKEGFETLHFGRTSWTNAGLRKYKLAWGTDEAPLTYLKQHTATGRWERAPDRSTGFYNQIFGRLPSIMNCLAGALIYPHLD